MIFTIIHFSMISCDDAETNSDPCIDKHSVTANFHIYEARQTDFPLGYEFKDSDTVASEYVMFEALEDNASYEWTLGAEKITTKKFVRHIFPKGQNINVQLKVTRLLISNVSRTMMEQIL